MLIKVKREYLAIWLKRLASVDLGSDMHDICKTIYMRLDKDKLTLIRTGNNRSFAIIRTDEIEGIEDAEEPLDALVSSERFYSIINKFSDGIIRIGTSTENDFCIEQGGYKGSWKQKLGKDGFPKEKALSFISKISELEPDGFKTIDAKQFVRAVDEIKYAPPESTFNPRLKNLVFNGGICWAVNHSRYHERELVDFPQMDLVIPKESFPMADFIHLSGVKEFKCYEDNLHYYFVVGDDYFILENSGLVAEEEKKSFLSEYNTPDFIKFNISSKKLLEAVERVGITADKKDTSISVTCQDNKITLESCDKLDYKSREDMPISLSGNAPTKFIRWDSLAESLNSVSPLDVEVRIYDKSMAIKTDVDKIILTFVRG